MRVHDVRLRRRAHAVRKLGVPTLAARATVEDRELDLVPALAQRDLQLAHEDAEVGIVRAGVHLRDEQDAHAPIFARLRRRSQPTGANASPTRTTPGRSTGAQTPNSTAPSRSRCPR